MIEIKFTGETFSALRTEVQEFAIAHLGFKFNTETTPTTRQEIVDTVKKKVAEASVETKRGPGRPPKIHNVAAPTEPVYPPQPAKVEVLEPATYEDCTKALKSVWDKFGLPKAMHCLNHFGVDHAKKLTQEQWPLFVDYCNATCAQKLRPRGMSDSFARN